MGAKERTGGLEAASSPGEFSADTGEEEGFRVFSSASPHVAASAVEDQRDNATEQGREVLLPSGTQDSARPSLASGRTAGFSSFSQLHSIETPEDW